MDIAGLNPNDNSSEDVTGGYIIKVDYYNKKNSWTSNYKPGGYHNENVHFVYHYPDEIEISNAQKLYIKDFINQFENAVFSTNTTRRHRELYKIMDINSFIDYFILGELSRNVDAYKKSSYFHKDKGGKLHAGPVWDFDWAWKNIPGCYFGATDGSGWAYQVHKCDPWPLPQEWMTRLLEYPYFVKNLSARYFKFRNSILSEDLIFSYIDSVALVLDQAQNRHFSKWQILGVNVGAPEVDEQPTSYSGEIAKFKAWIAQRLAWLDEHIPKFVVTDLENFESYNEIQLYPNPSYNQLTLQSKDVIKSYAIYGSNGFEVTSGLANSTSLSLDIRNLFAGLYLLKTHHRDGSYCTKQFVVSK